MNCRFADFRCKEVINICDGCRLGYVGDVECRLPDGQLTALIIPGPYRFFGLFGRGEEYCIPWECIKQIGDDIILIDKPFPRQEIPRSATEIMNRINEISFNSSLMREMRAAIEADGFAAFAARFAQERVRGA